MSLINIIIPSIRGGVFDECGYIIIYNVLYIIYIRVYYLYDEMQGSARGRSPVAVGY